MEESGRRLAFFRAEVAELVDARDLKSLGPLDRVGSSPTFGTLFSRWKRRDFLFVKTTFAPISINSKTCIFRYNRQIMVAEIAVID